MTDDPKRWRDDADAPTAMRDFLRDARLEAPTLDDETRQRVRARLTRSSSANARVVLGVLLVAAAAVVALVLSRVEPRDPIAVDPERDAGIVDGGRDGGVTPAPIRVERTCGEEDVDYACVVHVETARAYERIELHEAYGIAPPSCEGRRVATEWITRIDETRLTIASGVSYDPQLAIRACAYDGDALVATGTVEGTRSVPQLDDRGREDAAGTISYDLRVMLGDQIDDDVLTFVVVRQIHDDGGSTDDYPVSCDGDVVREIPRALALAFDEGDRVALPVHLDGETARAMTFAVCARDASGALTRDGSHGRRSYPIGIEPHVPTVLTPSGEIRIDALQVGHRVVTRIRVAQRPWATPTEATNVWVLDVVDRIDTWSDATFHRLRLADGSSAVVPSFPSPWSVERGAFVDIDDLHVGEHVLDENGAELAVLEITALPRRVDGYDLPVLAGPASYFFDGILVGAARARPRTLASGSPPSSPAPIEVWPEPASDCSVRATLALGDLDAVRATGATSIAIVFAPHRGHPGTLRDIDCATARVGFEASLNDLANVPIDATGRRQLSIDMPSIDDEDDLAPDGEIACDASYAVASCVRDASGLHGLGRGRWAESGPSCFAESTLVTTSEGPRAIATLRRGEAIESYDASADRTVMARVDRLIARGERPILTLALSSGAVLRVTAEHPLFDARSRSFRRAGSFAIGDALRGGDGADVVVIAVGDGGRARVYDVSVSGPHTFVADGVVVHNY